MNLLTWLYSLRNSDTSPCADEALKEARERLIEEQKRSAITKTLAERAEKSRKQNGYGKALRRALRGD